MLRKTLLIIFAPLIFFGYSLSQEKAGKVTVKGYLTTMQSAIFDSLSGPFINDNLLHNRLNFKYYPSDKIAFTAELRNRLFTGDMVKAGHAYAAVIGSDQGWIDMSWNILDKRSFLLNSTLDRFYLDFITENFQVTLGRQRINWGQALIWNPNDIFNAYSFFDFDYIERPGSDAVRLQFFTSASSAVEFALKVDDSEDVTAAGLFRFNRWGYDLQFLAGFVNSEDIVLGTGWSGAIGNYSIRGEASWFNPWESFPEASGILLLTTGFDRVFKNNSMVQLQVMYCNNPPDMISFNSFYTGNLSSKDLAYSEFSAFGQLTWAVNPLLNLTLSGMWFPDLDGYFAGPSLDYSLAENIDFSMIWQHFKGIMGGEKTRINLGFLRLKYSF